MGKRGKDNGLILRHEKQLLAPNPSVCQPLLGLLSLFMNQEKEILAKRVSAESSVTPKETIKDIGPAVHLALRAPQPKCAQFCKNPLLKTPDLGGGGGAREVRGEVCGEVWTEVSGVVFGLLLLGFSE